MKLAEYLKQNEIKQSDFANRIGVSRSMITHLCQRITNPSLALARRIVDATGGEVGYEDLPVADPTPLEPAEERIDG